MKNIVLLFILGFMLVSCNQTAQQDQISQPEHASATETAEEIAPEVVKDGLFIHITESYDDPHRVLMPLKMATMLASDYEVLVYMDIHAVELLVKDAKDLSFADFESAQSYIKQLAEMNIGVYACPSCLKIAGFTPEDLMDGVQVAQKDKFFNFTKGRIITLDY
jgi:predicted peroxiredoxin